MQANSTLAIDIGGTVPGTGYDRLSVAGPASLGGNLSVNFAGGFENLITNGAAFTILSAGSIAGTFANATNGAVFFTGLGKFTVTNTATNIVLTYRASRLPFAAWQMAFFGCTNCPQASATNDADGDGMNNWKEWVSGTVPTNSSSLLRVVAMSVSNSNLIVTWSAVSNAQYVVQSAGTLTNAATDLATVTVPDAVSVTQTNYLQTGGATNASRFFWIKLIAP
jgi:hypothetical protein